MRPLVNKETPGRRRRRPRIDRHCEIFVAARAAARDHRYAHRRRDIANEVYVVAGHCAVAVNGVEKNLSRPAPLKIPRKGRRIKSSVLSSARNKRAISPEP